MKSPQHRLGSDTEVRSSLNNSRLSSDIATFFYLNLAFYFHCILNCISLSFFCFERYGLLPHTVPAVCSHRDMQIVSRYDEEKLERFIKIK